MYARRYLRYYDEYRQSRNSLRLSSDYDTTEPYGHRVSSGYTTALPYGHRSGYNPPHFPKLNHPRHMVTVDLRYLLTSAVFLVVVVVLTVTLSLVIFLPEGNSCSTNHCLNNGMCHDLNGRYICECASGYQGPNCENTLQQEGNSCSTNHCLNNGTCHDLNGRYICECASGYQGPNCENTLQQACMNMNSDLCDPSPCVQGTCVQSGDVYACRCDEGWTGVNCSQRVSCCDPVVLHATRSSNSTTHYSGDVLTFQCIDSTLIGGNTSLECLSDGSWSHDPPVCGGCPETCDGAATYPYVGDCTRYCVCRESFLVPAEIYCAIYNTTTRQREEYDPAVGLCLDPAGRC